MISASPRSTTLAGHGRVTLVDAAALALCSPATRLAHPDEAAHRALVLGAAVRVDMWM